MEQLENSQYLEKEKVSRLLLKFSLPCIFSLIISCLYNIVDQIFVGNGIGYLGNAATGIIFPITVIGWGASLFFGDGAAAYLSVALGQKETKSINKSVANSILFSFLSGVLIIAICYIAGEHLLRSIGATDATIGLASDYGIIIYIMMPLAMTQNTLASIIRADGSPRYSMIAMLIGAVINIIGDAVAIFALDMGIKGAAYATILGQFISFLICIAYLRRSKSFRLSKADFIPEFSVLKRVMALGSSSFLTQISIVVITIINNILLVKYGALSDYGSDIPLAAFVVIMKLFQIILNIAIGIAAGAQPIVGYNYGAQQYSRVRELLKLIIKWTIIVCATATLLIEVFPLVFIRIFGTSGELYLTFAAQCLRIYLSLIIFTCVQKVCAIFLQSIGKASYAAPLAVLRDLLLIVFSITVPVIWGVTGIFWAAPVADTIAISITAFFMLKVWRELSHADVTSKNSIENGASEQMTAGDVSQSDATFESRVPASACEANSKKTASPMTAIQPSRPGIIITISREHGSSGKKIGQLVAQQLDIPCYYKELTALAAHESGLSSQFISELNMNAPDALRQLYLSTNVIQQAIAAQNIIIKKISEKGSCVIVGRAADYVLREQSDVVRIYIHAPKDYRIKKIQEMYGDTAEQAKKSMHRSDEARSSYYSNISGMHWGQAQNYELCIDSSIGVDATAAAIIGYLNSRLD